VGSKVRQRGVDLAVEPFISEPHGFVANRFREACALDHHPHRGIAKHQ
jgi:hypothetical protein